MTAPKLAHCAEAVIADYKAGMLVKAVAAKYKVDEATVKKLFRKHGVETRPWRGLHWIDHTGEKIGRWTVLKFAGHKYRPNGKKQSYFLCRCECGTEREVLGPSLRNGTSTSCGCYAAERCSQKNTTHGESKGHGKTKQRSKEYNAYVAAKKRCNNRNQPSWPDYGGRGIEFRFNSFEEWLACLGRAPSPEHSVDRYPNNDGHYEPGNVRWASPAEQGANKRPRIRKRFIRCPHCDGKIYGAIKPTHNVHPPSATPRPKC